ncbi:hypothetical protein [Mucilaginibacter myungsuensis]|uniref:Uncharacterized protein n=1 Tax=Mucilaginibacter myungsuensis TaxID=649104 RepID=A0A929KTL6_9SPHI|nr:hypothetical protein [Mucilaginibacter myungsuensis]MBE9660942.1 hypothetical protein [Mucilaginibacter myungsuensis]MDN3600988.1 hypothetical protein [Mucilaginibacter myungsuensis]
MPTRSSLSLAGFILLIIATYFPLLRPFGLRSMNMFDLSMPFGMVVLLAALMGLLGVVLKQRALAKFCGWISLFLIFLLLIASYLKIHNAFSFIPFKGIAGFLTRQIKFKWGWWALFGGSALAILGNATGVLKPDKSFK